MANILDRVYVFLCCDNQVVYNQADFCMRNKIALALIRIARHLTSHTGVIGDLEEAEKKLRLYNEAVHAMLKADIKRRLK